MQVSKLTIKFTFKLSILNNEVRAKNEPINDFTMEKKLTVSKSFLTYLQCYLSMVLLITKSLQKYCV